LSKYFMRNIDYYNGLLCMLDAIALEAASRDSQKFVVYVQLVYPDDSLTHSLHDVQTSAKVHSACFAFSLHKLV